MLSKSVYLKSVCIKALRSKTLIQTACEVDELTADGINTCMAKQNLWSTAQKIPSDLLIGKELVYDQCGYVCSLPQMETESSDYGACTFKINNLTAKFRTAKITPTKTGQFVTFWKRIGKGPIQPFSNTDKIDLFIVSVRKGNRLGQFIFTKEIFIEKGILSTKTKEGKRALRVYPPWDKTTSAQAQKTQTWQKDFFIEFSEGKLVDTVRTKSLIG